MGFLSPSGRLLINRGSTEGLRGRYHAGMTWVPLSGESLARRQSIAAALYGGILLPWESGHFWEWVLRMSNTQGRRCLR